MPRRYFHFHNGTAILDQDGVDLPDMTATRTEAIETLAAVLRDEDVATLWHGQPFRLWVTDMPDGSGRTVLALNISPEPYEAGCGD